MSECKTAAVGCHHSQGVRLHCSLGEVTLRGVAHEYRDGNGAVHYQHVGGAHTDVDATFWSTWLAENPNHPLLLNKTIFELP